MKKNLHSNAGGVMHDSINNIWSNAYGGVHYDPLSYLVPYRNQISDLIATAKPDSSDRILDAGCGTGNVTALLAQSKPALLVGMDCSDAMLEQAVTKFPEITFVVGDLARQLKFETGSFSLVTCANVLYTLPDSEYTISEFRRILKPTGRLVLVTPKKGADIGMILRSQCDVNEPDEDWSLPANSSAEKCLALVSRCFDDPVQIEAFMKIVEHNQQLLQSSEMTFYTKSELHRTIEAAGFNRITITTTYAEQAWLVHAHV